MGQNSSTLSSSDDVNFFYLITSVYQNFFFTFYIFSWKGHYILK